MKKLLKLFFSCLLVFFGFSAFAQNYPVYSNFYNNLYLYNPAEAGNERRSFASLNHRRQWLGIEGAPVVSTLVFHTPFDKSRGAFGAKISSFSRGLLSTNDLVLTYRYSIPLTEELNLNFGLSGGLVSNNIDLDQASAPADPAIANYLANNLQPAGNFGLHLETPSGLNFGFSLPQLFGQTFANESSFEGFSNISPFDNAIGMIYYKRKVQQQIRSRSNQRYRSSTQIAPLEFYLVYKYSSIGTSQLEALAKLNLNEAFWVGASYKQGHGITGNTGINAGNLTVSYGYDPSFNQVSGLGNGTHELQLSLRIGKEKALKVSEVQIQSRLSSVTDDKHQARYQGGEETEIRGAQSDKDDKSKRYLIYIKTFRDFASADDFSQKLRKQEFNANVYYYEKTKKYYVYIFEADKAKTANQERKNLAKATRFKNPQILIVEEED